MEALYSFHEGKNNRKSFLKSEKLTNTGKIHLQVCFICRGLERFLGKKLVNVIQYMMEHDLVPNARQTGKWVDRTNDAVFDELHVIKWSTFI